MNIETKKKLYMMRWEDKSIQVIGEALEYTSQMIGCQLKLLEKEYDIQSKERRQISKLDYTKEELEEIFDGLANGTSLKDIQQETSITTQKIKDVIEYITSKKIGYKPSLYYPAIPDWLYANGLTQAWLADKIGLPVANLSRYLTGKSNKLLPYNAAVKLSNITGLSFLEIYEAQLENNNIEPTLENVQFIIKQLKGGVRSQEIKNQLSKKASTTDSEKYMSKPPRKRK